MRRSDPLPILVKTEGGDFEPAAGRDELYQFLGFEQRRVILWIRWNAVRRKAASSYWQACIVNLVLALDKDRRRSFWSFTCADCRWYRVIAGRAEFHHDVGCDQIRGATARQRSSLWSRQDGITGSSRRFPLARRGRGGAWLCTAYAISFLCNALPIWISAPAGFHAGRSWGDHRAGRKGSSDGSICAARPLKARLFRLTHGTIAPTR